MIEQNQGDCYELRRIIRLFMLGAIALVVSLVLALLVGIFWAGRASAETPTPAQVAACAPDAQRLCPEFIPDHVAVRACMIRRRSQLSQACKEAFAK